MQGNILKFNWVFGLVLLAAFGGGLLALAGFVTHGAFAETAAGIPRLPGWTPLTVVILDLVCVTVCLWFGWIFYGHWKAELTTEHVQKPALFGTCTIRWDDVTRIEAASDIRIFHGKRFISLAPFAYLNAMEIFAELEKHQIQRGRDVAA